MQEVAETKNKYLQESQIENVKSELESLPDNIDGFVRLLTMIDGFVRANGTADGEYEAIFTLVTTLDVMQSSQMEYDAVVKSTFPILAAIGFYDYLLLTGVLSAEEIKRFKGHANFPFSGAGGTPQA